MDKIIAFSIIMWIIIDRFKKIWEASPYKSIITTVVALVFGAFFAFTYKLDMLYELNMVENLSIGGYICTALILTGGSSCIHEVLDKLGLVVNVGSDE